MLERSPGGPGPASSLPQHRMGLARCSLTLVVPITCHCLHIRRARDYGKRNLRVGEIQALHAPCSSNRPLSRPRSSMIPRHVPHPGGLSYPLSFAGLWGNTFTAATSPVWGKNKRAEPAPTPSASCQSTFQWRSAPPLENTYSQTLVLKVNSFQKAV